jgi:hypothetical protein
VLDGHLQSRRAFPVSHACGGGGWGGHLRVTSLFEITWQVYPDMFQRERETERPASRKQNPDVSSRTSAETSLYCLGFAILQPDAPNRAECSHTTTCIFRVGTGSTRAERPLIVPRQHRGSKEIVHTGAQICAPCLRSPRYGCYCSNESFVLYQGSVQRDSRLSKRVSSKVLHASRS